MEKNKSVASALALSVTLLVSGCNSNNSSSANAPAAFNAKLSGSILDQTGPVTQGRLEVSDKNGQVVVKTPINNGNHYSVTIPAGTVYPIVLTAYPEGGISNAPVKAVVTSPIAETQDITSVSTIVVDSAMGLGGLTAENIARASGGAIGLRQSSGGGAAAGGGGAGPGQSGGGVGRGGHGGHGMDGKAHEGMSGDSGQDMEGMSH
ncbi:MAG: hypothetical protein RIQ52_240 [Pseudomonadota bacterium]|jgi:hypothetical protein